MRRLALLLSILALPLVPAGALAGQPVTQTLTPPPPSFETCKATGSGTICQGSRSEGGYGPVGTGLFCGTGAGAFEIFDSASDHIQHHAMRFYDANGNLTRRVFTDTFVGGQYSNPLTGATVRYTQHQITTGVLAVPGDLSTETQTIRGEVNFVVPGMGAVFLNAGRVVYAPDGSIEFQAGPQGFNDYFVNGNTAALDQLCAALGAP